MGTQPPRVLILQGPLSKFYSEIGDELRQSGAYVLRVNFCGSDRMNWHAGGAINYRGSLSNWPEFLAGLLEKHSFDIVLLHGDRRVYHQAAIALAKKRGLKIVATELGYLRPDWMTVEVGGCNALSHFPKDPQEIREMAKNASPLAGDRLYQNSYSQLVFQELKFTVDNLLFHWAFPKYENHRQESRLTVYGGWLKARLLSKKRELEAARTLHKVTGQPYYVFALQLNGDFQIRDHSPFGSIYKAIDHVAGSFALHAPAGTNLVLKCHPLEYRHAELREAIEKAEREHGLEERLFLLDGSNIQDLSRDSLGLVTVNSSAGLESIEEGVPTCCIMPTIYDVEGLTHQGELDHFWASPQKPDLALFDAFRRLLCQSVLVRGTIYNRAGRKAAARAVANKITQGNLNPAYSHPPRLARAAQLGVSYQHYY
ncbi:capsular biosynthesis protein [Flexibacterium corallicola]|uniref:capsular biosynthesis protein n=1 Tax=Flexibacterium corallicola TaxID=3037259 RepID=UPI00286F5B7C|nr:capsular biosynthesis protein [Pseudovibrio sp. M1P-2-3]